MFCVTSIVMKKLSPKSASVAFSHKAEGKPPSCFRYMKTLKSENEKSSLCIANYSIKIKRIPLCELKWLES